MPEVTSLFPDAQPLGATPPRPTFTTGSSLFPEDEQTTRIRSAVEGAQTASPDKAARVLKLQTKTGLPPELIERNIDDIEREAARADFDAEKFRRESPALASWIASNPKHAEVAAGDIENLSRIDRLIGAATRGAYSLMQSGSALSLGANSRALAEADALDRALAEGKAPGAIPDGQDAAGYRWMTPTQRASYRHALGEGISGNVSSITRRQGQIEQIPVDPVVAQALGAKSFADFWSAFSQKPVDFVLTVGAESLPQMLPALGLGVAGAFTGGIGLAAGGAGAGSFGVDYAASTLDALRDEGVDLKDRDSIAAAVADRDLMRRVGQKAFSHAAPVAAFDASSAALAGLRLVPARQAAGVGAAKASTGSMAVSAGRAGTELAGQAVAQGTLGAAGEAAGQYAQGKTELDAGQVMAEFFGEFAGAPVEVGGMAAAGVRRNLRETLRAKERQAFFEALGEGVSQSATFQRMPEKVREYIASATRDGPVENIYVPVEAWQTFWQSQNVDPREAAAEITGQTTYYDDALRTGTDITIPLADYATKIAPNAQATAAFMAEIRLRPDELNGREAQELETELQKQAAQPVEDAPGATSAAKVREDVVGQLLGQGFDRSTVDAYASMYERAFATMGTRAGLDPFALYQRYGLRIGRPLPQALQAGPKVDALDALIDRVRSLETKAQPELMGESLLPFLRRHGLQDMGGELTGREVDRSLKPFERRLVREDGLPLDRAMQAAIESGYFPDGETDISDLLSAIDEELAGRPRYATKNIDERSMAQNDAVQALGQHLESLGLDVRELSNEEIKKALEAASGIEGRIGDVVFEQDGTRARGFTTREIQVDGKWRPIQNSEGHLLGATFAEQAAFWRWFGDSKVVDENGRPLVVYHGTADDFAEFSAEEGGKNVRTPASRQGFFFSDRPDIAERYAQMREGTQQVMPVYLSIQDPDRATVSNMMDADRFLAGGFIGDGAIVTVNTPAEGITRSGFLTQTVYAVKDPTQIKSVFNRGTFDPLSGNILFQPAYHGSPHSFDSFSLDKIGTGEGAQAFGWGLYFTEEKEIAEHYRRTLSDSAPTSAAFVKGNRIEQNTPEHHGAALLFFNDNREIKATAKRWLKEYADSLGMQETAQKAGLSAEEYWTRLNDFVQAHKRKDINIVKGQTYEVEVPEDDKLLLWDKPMSSQPDYVKEKLKAAGVLRDFKENMSDFASPMDTRGKGKGENLYAYLAWKHGGPRQASEFLDGLGIPGHKFKQNTLTGRPGKGYNFVIWNEGAVKMLRTLYQEYGEGKRGAISFGADRQFNIALFERANLSTFIHESGHFYLEVFGDVVDELRSKDAATLNDTQRQMIADYDAALKWLGVDNRAAIGVEQHEQFARGLEAYFRENKAPSPALRSIFAKFRAWLVNVYRSLTQLRVTLSPEITHVMDRILATDEEIEAAEREADIEAMFTDAKQAGMTDEEFAAYRRTVRAASEVARDKLQAKLMRQMQRERETWWKAEREKVRAEVAAEIYARPEYIALSILQRGTLPDGSPLPEGMQAVKLDRAWLADAYGSEFLKRLPRPYVYAKEGGVNPEIAATILGFSSGDELVMALANARPMRALIEAETDQRMKDAHGDMMLDGSMADAARAAVQNEERSKVIEAEMKALRKKQREVAGFVRAERDRAGREADYQARWFEAERKLAVAIQKGEDQAVIDALRAELQQIKAHSRQGAAMLNSGIPSLDAIRAMARGRIAQMMVRDLQPSLYLIAARKASKAATRAAATDDFNEALIQKQRELMNVELYRAATDAQEAAESTREYMASFDRKAKRERIGKAGGDFLDQIDGLLDRFEFKRVSLKVLERRRALASWVADKERQGLPVNIPQNLIEEAGRRNWREMTVEELAGLRDTVKHIEHLATLKNKLLKAKAKRELDAAVADLVQTIRDNAKGRPRSIETRLPGDEAARLVSGWFASHRKIASFVRQMDGFKDGGDVWEYIVRPLNDAASEEAAMKEQATVKLGELFDAYRGREAAELYRKRHIAEINAPLTKMGRLMVALNWGNEGNRQRVMSGYGWNENQVKAILATLDERDWKFVQGVWDFIDSYWSAIEAKQKRVDGVAPAKVERSKFTATVRNADGTSKDIEIPGGYFPIKYDDRQSAKAGANLEAEFADIAKQASYVRASTRRGHTEARAEKVELPIRLDFGVVFEHVNQVIHDLTHHEMLLDAGRLLGHKELQAAIYETYGDIVFKEFKRALVDVAIGDTPAGTAWEKSISHLRQGVSVAYMGWNLMTSLQQPLGLFNSMVRVGPKWIAKGMTRWLRDAAGLENTAAWVHDRSEFMRLRHKTQQREISEIRNQVGVQSGRLSGWVDEALRNVSADHVTKQGIADSYFWLIAKAQMIADVPTWLGEYEKQMAAGETEERAAALADQAVIDSQGGGQIKDLASIQRGGPMLKLWTNFYSIFNVTWNQAVESTRRTNFSDPISIGRLAVDYLLLSIMPATMGALIKEAITGGGDDDLWKSLARENLQYLFGLMVGLREIGSAALGFAGYEGPAGTRFFASIGKFVKQSAQGEADAAFWKSLNDTAGILLHYPAGQVRRTVEGYQALTEGKTHNPLALVFGAPKQ